MRLNNPQMMFLITMASGLMAALCLLICLTLAIKLRSLKKQFKAFAADVEANVADMEQTAESVSVSTADYARRIAWLESRVRSNKPAPKEDREEAAFVAAEPSLTERRHRVISLARRGYDVNTIASMLNEMPGEVELIIGLSKAA
jgi:DNA-binding NarL/FixJ family response regulator